MKVVLYGATGFTGKLTARELQRRGLDIVLAGRSAEKLASLSAELNGEVRYRAVGSEDRAGLLDLFADATVVVNCAGPFTVTGHTVAGAAAETGSHYIDSTGEQGYMKAVYDNHGATAERNGAALVPAMAFDFVPGDCIARIVARECEPVRELVLAYSVEGFGMTRGTMRSALTMIGTDTLEYRDGSYRPTPTGIFRGHFDFPAPIGRKRMSRYPSGEIITIPMHTDVHNITSLLTTSTTMPQRHLEAAMPYTEPVMAKLLRTPLNGALYKAIGRLPEGPSEDNRSGVRWTICAVAHGEDSSTASGVVRGEDIYGITATMLGHAAEQMAAEGYDRAGALTPATAFDPVELLDAFASDRLTYEAPLAALPV